MNQEALKQQTKKFGIAYRGFVNSTGALADTAGYMENVIPRSNQLCVALSYNRNYFNGNRDIQAFCAGPYRYVDGHPMVGEVLDVNQRVTDPYMDVSLFGVLTHDTTAQFEFVPFCYAKTYSKRKQIIRIPFKMRSDNIFSLGFGFRRSGGFREGEDIQCPCVVHKEAGMRLEHAYVGAGQYLSPQRRPRVAVLNGKFLTEEEYTYKLAEQFPERLVIRDACKKEAKKKGKEPAKKKKAK